MSIRAFALFAALFAAAPAPAGGLADEAELHFELAAEKYIARDYRGALEHFLLSNRLVPNKNVVFNIARTYEQLERYPDAHRYYLDALAVEPDPKIKEQLQAAIARIAPKVAVLDVTTDPPNATIYLDRRDLGSRGTTPRALGLPAGKYRVLVELEGYQPAETQPLDAALGAAIPVALKLERIVGTVSIETAVDLPAAVRVDREDAPEACRTPCQLELPPGPHILFLERSGYEQLARSIAVVAGETLGVQVRLTPLTGTLVVSAQERDALVEIDGRPAGFTPAVVSNVPVGLRRVRVELRGFQPVERDVEVKANQQTELAELRLDPLQEITAASRYTEQLEDAPGSVSVIPFEELRAFAYPTIFEALRGVRGFSLSNDGVYPALNIRGIGQPNDYGNRVVVLSDGLVLNDDIVSSSYVGYDGRVDLGDLERIEIVRGAGSLLYGTGAISGVINLVTRPRDTPTRVQGVAGTADNGVAHGRAGFTLHLGPDAGVWASVAAARSDGRSVTVESIPGLSTSSTATHLEKFHAETIAGRVWSGPFSASWFYTSRDQKTPFGPYGTVFGSQETGSVDRRAAAELRYEPQLGSFAQLLLRGYGNYYNFNGEFDYGSIDTEEEYRGRWAGLEGRLTLTPLEDVQALRISVGGMAERHFTAELRGFSVSSTDRRAFLFESHPFTVGAVYAVAEVSPLEFMRLTGGVRLDSYTTFGLTLNPRVSMVLRPWTNGVFKLFGGRAFRAPSIYELYYRDGGFLQLPNPKLEPESSYSAEAEYSHRVFEDWIVLGALHVNYLENIIETRGGSIFQYMNRSESLVTGGGELELRREWRQGWMFAASYGFERVGDLINAPAHLGSIKGSAPVIPGAINLAARLSVEGPRRIRIYDEEKTEAAVVADLVLTGKLMRFPLRWSAGVYNLFDWDYHTPITEGSRSDTLQQSGRTFLLSLELELELEPRM